MKEIITTDAFNLFKPENCIFVLSVEADGHPSGMTACWQMKCSHEPPLMAISLFKSGYTHKLIKESKEFVIAVPNKSQENDLLYFGSNHGDKVDKFKETGIETLPAKYLKTPLLKNASMNFECVLEKEVDSGDHIIFIGRVVAAHVDEGKKILLNMKKENGQRVFEEY